MSGSPFTVYSGVQQTGAGAGGTDRPDLVTTPHFSTSRAVRSDYFGRGDDNAILLQHPDQSSRRHRPQPRPLRHARPQHLPRPRLPQLRRRTDQRHSVRPPRQQRIRHAGISRRILQRLQHRELRFALQHRPRQRLRPDQQNRRLLKTDSVFGEVDLLTTLELIRKSRVPHPCAFCAQGRDSTTLSVLGSSACRGCIAGCPILACSVRKGGIPLRYPSWDLRRAEVALPGAPRFAIFETWDSTALYLLGIDMSRVSSTKVVRFTPIRLSTPASDQAATHATRERYMRTRPPRAALRQLQQTLPDQAA